MKCLKLYIVKLIDNECVILSVSPNSKSGKAFSESFVCIYTTQSYIRNISLNQFFYIINIIISKYYVLSFGVIINYFIYKNYM